VSAAKHERNAAIREAFARGLGYRAISRDHGITPQRVRQIVDPDRHLEHRRRRATARRHPTQEGT
jgi:transposase-like protein